MNGNYNPDIQALVVRWHCFFFSIFKYLHVDEITIYCFISEISRFTPCLWTSFELYFLTLVFYYKTIFVLLHVRILIGGLIQLFQYLKNSNEIIYWNQVWGKTFRRTWNWIHPYFSNPKSNNANEKKYYCFHD